VVVVAKWVAVLIRAARDDEPDDESPNVKVRAAEDLISAVETGDAKGVADAFKRMYDACAAEHGSDAEDETEEEY